MVTWYILCKMGLYHDNLYPLLFQHPFLPSKGASGCLFDFWSEADQIMDIDLLNIFLPTIPVSIAISVLEATR